MAALIAFLATLEWLARAGAAYLYLETLKYPERINDECDELEERIEALRLSPNSSDQLLADRLRVRLQRKRGVSAQAISTADLGAPKGSSRSD